jgi:putative phosphoesterase
VAAPAPVASGIGSLSRLRYGVLADIHGNLPALEAVLRALRREGVDGYLCAGDLVGYGPYPNECVDVIRSLEPICVAGNHDLIAIGRLSPDRLGGLARLSLEWTRGVLLDETRDYLERLPPVAATADGVVVAHGALADPQEYTRESEQAIAQLELLRARNPEAAVLVLGHTHLAAAYASRGGPIPPSADGSITLAGDERFLLNPGSVGQSRERRVRARCLLLDLDDRRATFFALRYDLRRCRRALRRAGLPARSVHPVPGRLARSWGRMRRRVHRMRKTAA